MLRQTRRINFNKIRRKARNLTKLLISILKSDPTYDYYPNDSLQCWCSKRDAILAIIMKQFWNSMPIPNRPASNVFYLSADRKLLMISECWNYLRKMIRPIAQPYVASGFWVRECDPCPCLWKASTQLRPRRQCALRTSSMVNSATNFFIFLLRVTA